LLIFLVFCVAVFCFCFVCVRPVSSVPNVVSVSGFSIRFSLMFISGACGSYHDFLGGLLLTRKLLHQGFLVVKLKSSFRRLYSRHHDLISCFGISVTDDHGYACRSDNPVLSSFMTYHWVCKKRVTRWGPHVVQKLLTIPVHLISLLAFSGVRVAQSFLCNVFQIIVCQFDLCMAIVLFVLRFTDSDPFDIFKLFL